MPDPSSSTAHHSLPEPLIGDAARQAMDSMAGYDYQILRTVEAWLQLDADQKIYIECAEDYDVTGPDGAVATQVKNSAQNITLNSKDVKEAIRNFWALLERSATTQNVCMRFLTRGSIGREQLASFGEPGLVTWQRAATTGNDELTRLVRDHLIAQGGTGEFLSFLHAASAEQLRERLLKRIEWVTNEPSDEAVRLAVKRLAVNMGFKSGIPSTISSRAVPALLDHCRQVATKSEPELRSLTQADLLLVFEGSTSVSVPITNALVNSLGLFLGTSSGGNQTALTFAPVFDGELPELPAECIPRTHFISQTMAQLRTSGAVLVVGAEGEGKSTAANLMARLLGDSAFWSDLRGGDLAVSVAAVENAIVLSRSGRPASCLVLDDVPVAQGVPDVLWGRLKILIDSCRRNSIPLVMTSKGVPADAVDSRFHSATISAAAVPRISEPELITYLESLGCSGSWVQGWARMTLLHTGDGHPKLVHLAALELRDHGWAPGSVEEYLSGPSRVREARAAARQRAARDVALPDRDLLFALTLTTSPFSRDVALRLGNGLQIAEPGASFDRLDGRWVERIGRGVYRATPLLSGQAPSIWSDDRVRETHGLFFDAYLGTGTISTVQAMTVALHGLQSRDGQRLAPFLANLLTHSDESEGLLEALEALVHIGVQDEVPAISFDANASVLLRNLQFHIARARRPELLVDIARRWLWEINQLPNPHIRGLFLGMRGMVLCTSFESSLPADPLIEALQHFVEMEDVLAAMGETWSVNDAFEDQDSLVMLFVVAQSSVRTSEQLSEMLTALDNAAPAFRSRVLQAFDMPILRSGVSMFDRALVGEMEASVSDWARLARMLKDAVDIARRWQAQACEESALRALSVVLSEHLGDHETALQILEEVHGSEHRPVLQEQRANLAYGRQQYGEAVRLWSQCLWTPDTVQSGLKDCFAMRKAGMACARLGRYGDAARWFMNAAEVAESDLDLMPSALFRIDASQCWFRQGEYAHALGELGVAWLQVRHPVDPQEEPRKYAALKFVGILARWMWQILRGAPQEGPVIGIGGASRPDLDIDAVQADTPAPADMVANVLIRVVTLVGVDMPWLGEAWLTADSSEDPVLIINNKSIKIGRLLGERRFGEIGVEVVGMLKSMKCQQQLVDQQVGEAIERDIAATVRYAFALALSIDAMSGSGPSALLNSWTSAIPSSPEGQQALSIAREVATAFDISVDAAMPALWAGESWVAKIGAASVALGSQSLPPRKMAQVQQVIAHFLTALPARKFLQADMTRIADQFSEQWRGRLEAPALLNSPRTSVPLLQAATSMGGSPEKRILALTVAAAAASGTSVPQPIRNSLLAAVAEAELTEPRVRQADDVVPEVPG